MAFDTAIITQLEPMDVFLEVTPITCSNGEICITNVLGGTGDYTFTWSGTGIEGLTDSCVSITEGGIYTLNIMDENGCDKSVAIQVVDEGCCFTPGGILVVDATCGQENGFAEIDLISVDSLNNQYLTYTWTDNISTSDLAEDLAPGIYYVTIENGRAECTQIIEVAVGSVDAPNLEIDETNPTICPTTDGSVSLTWTNGVAPFQILIDGGTPLTATSPHTFTGLQAGMHEIEIIDAEGCNDFLAVTIASEGGLTINTTTIEATCGVANGTATIAVIPADNYTFTWSDGGTGDIRSDLASGVYTVTIATTTGCTDIAEVLVNEVGATMPTVTATDITCVNACDGSMLINTGTGVIIVRDENGNIVTLAEMSGALCAGDYTIAYTDENGCDAYQTVSITESEAIDAFLEITPITCEDGEICITNILGGSGIYTYTWSGTGIDGLTDDCVSITQAGTYVLTIMDSKGCDKEVALSVDDIGCVSDLALLKKIAAGGPQTVQPGAFVTYDITVINQGLIDAYNISIIDYTPAGLIYNDSYGSNATIGWSDADGDGNPEMTIAGPINATATVDSFTVQLTLQVDPNLTTPTSLVNVAEVTGSEDENGNTPTDTDSTPDTDDSNDGPMEDNSTNNENGDEDDSDPATLYVEEEPVFDLALRKTIDPSITLPAYVGDTILFNIEIINQGNIDAQNIELTDAMGACLDINAANMLGWVDADNDGLYEYIITNTLAVGTSTTIPMSVVITCNATHPDDYLNIAEISAAEDPDGNHPDDIDSTPDMDPSNDPMDEADNDETEEDGKNGEDEDDHDWEEVPVELFDLALIKQVSPTQPMPIQVGDDVTYVFTVFNQGTVDAYNIDVVDYLPTGVALSPNDLNGWTDINLSLIHI